MTEVWRLEIPCTDKMVLLALADAANDDGVTWIAMRTMREGKADLIQKCSLSERAIQMAVKRLCDAGYLSRIEKSGRGVIYTVTPAGDAPPQEMRPAGDAGTPARRAPKPSTNLTDIISSEIISVPHSPKAARGARLDPDWRPSETETDFALNEGLTHEETDREADQFRDYWCAKSTGATKLDWTATWRSWVRKVADRKRERGARLASSSAFCSGGGQGPSDFAGIAARNRGYA